MARHGGPLGGVEVAEANVQAVWARVRRPAREHARRSILVASADLGGCVVAQFPRAERIEEAVNGRVQLVR